MIGPQSADLWRLTAVLSISAMAVGCSRESPRQGADTAARAPSETAAPDSFRVAFETTRGNFVVDVIRAWSPRGADRFHALVDTGYFTDIAFIRVLPGFVAQFGMHGDPAVNRRWERPIPDDPVVQSNRRGTIVFATSGPNTRGNQFFINYSDNTRLDGMGFSPFGRVVEGMSVVDSIYSGYGEMPDQSRVGAEGNAYLKREFPRLDYIKSARIVGPTSARAP
ncbi:MAG TPA: peptidylprolyl isomerase [Gemmatimonadaceae bacterium]|nr:peptidylprolyl isomerase [Gemmatimonadaceae bacterium]